MASCIPATVSLVPVVVGHLLLRFRADQQKPQPRHYLRLGLAAHLRRLDACWTLPFTKSSPHDIGDIAPRMDDFDNEVEHPKKRRRRFANQKPISAHLTFDESLHEDVAVLSPDLWSQLTAGISHIALSLGSSTHRMQKPPMMDISP